MKRISEIVIYQNKDKKIEVSLKEETIWLSLNQIAFLFDKDKSVISRHIRNIFETGELQKYSTVANFATVQTEGNRKVKRNLTYYNLDVIISVGYRVNSKRATMFRIWATQVLKDYLTKGYAINEKNLTEEKLKELENTINTPTLFEKEVSAAINTLSRMAKDESLHEVDIILPGKKKSLLKAKKKRHFIG